MFPSDVEPAHVARRLVATMEARTEASSGGRMTAPARYTVLVNPIDYARLSDHRAYLQDEWSALLEDVAGRAGIALDGKATVRMQEEDRVAAGAMEIHVERGKPIAAPVRFILRPLGSLPNAPQHTIDGAARVGRSTDCDIVLADPSVSRNHALLDVRSKALYVRDTGSTNGTYVNGTRVEESALRAGDVVAFGKSLLEVVRPK